MDLNYRFKLHLIQSFPIWSQCHYVRKHNIIVFQLTRTKNIQTIALRWAEAKKEKKMFCPSAMFSLHFPTPCQWLQNKRICELNPIVLKRSAAKFRHCSCSPSMWKNVPVMFVCFIFFLSFIPHCNLGLHTSHVVWTSVSGVSMHVSRRKGKKNNTYTHI